MKKTAIAFLLTASMVGGVTTVATAAPVTADNTSAVKVQQTAYDNAQAQLQAAQTNLEQISNEISNLTREIDENNAQITKNEQQLQVFTKEYNQDLQVEASRIKAIYQNGDNTGILSVMLSSKNIGQFISRYYAVSKLMQLDAQAVQKTQADKNSIATTTTNLNTLKASNEAKLKDLNTKKAAAQTLVKQMQDNSAMQAQKLAQAKATAQASINLLNEAKTKEEVNNAVTVLKHIESTTTDASVKKEVSNALSTSTTKIKQVQAQPAPVTQPAPVVHTAPEPAPTTTNNTLAPKPAVKPSVPVKSSGGSAQAQQIISYAMNFLGDPYVWGATGPNSFDCSGLTGYVFAHFGYNIGYSTYAQIDEGTPVSTSNLQPGDLIFWGDPSAPYHVAIYIGGGEYIQAPHTGANVDISSWNLSNISAARRIL